jgi:hypothetical protein
MATLDSAGRIDRDTSYAVRPSQRLLSDHETAFKDPNAPTFGPGPNAAAPGLVVLLSTTPNMRGTPLHGPNTNLAGVVEINDVSQLRATSTPPTAGSLPVPGSSANAGKPR